MQKTKNTYKKSGVNINLADRFVEHIAKISKKNVKKKKKYLNKDNIGAFGSTFDISKIKIKDPLIVSSTDGVGTKIDLANQFNKFDTIGIDLVAMCVNDLIVQGAKPLFFLDYMAVGKIKFNKLKKILNGIIKGCDISDCVTITEPSSISITSSQNNISCNGANDGNATVSPLGGTGSFTFIWDSGQTTANATGLNAGQHCVTVSDANLCPEVHCVTITEFAPLTVSTISVTNPSRRVSN